MSTGLTTRGRCLLAAGAAAAVCAVLLDERDMLRVAVFVVALPLLAALLSTRARHGLAVRRGLHPPRVTAGDETAVVLRVSSRSRVPATGLLLEDAVPYAAGARPRFVVDRLGTAGAVELRYPLRPALRGSHEIGPLSARVSDPFGLAEFTRTLGEPARLLVVPRTATLRGMPRGHGRGSGEDSSVRMRSGQGAQDAVVRQYRHGDDLRKVHWRSTAHRDELMVRLEDRPWRSGTTVLLDHRASAHRGHGTGASLEWAVSFAASVCLHLHAQRHTVRLVTEDGGLVAGEAPGANPGVAILDSLAALTPTHRRDLAAGGRIGEGDELVAVLGALSGPGARQLTAARPSGTRGLAVLLDIGAWSPANTGEPDDAEESARTLRASGWGVVVAGPADSLTGVWDELCRSAPTYAGVAP